MKRIMLSLLLLFTTSVLADDRESCDWYRWSQVDAALCQYKSDYTNKWHATSALTNKTSQSLKVIYRAFCNGKEVRGSTTLSGGAQDRRASMGTCSSQWSQIEIAVQ